MSYDNSIYDGVEFVAHDLDTMRKQYERLRYDHAVTLSELEALRTAVELLATEVAWRCKVGFCPNEAYEAVSNNQTCRTAITDAGHKPVTFSKEDVR